MATPKPPTRIAAPNVVSTPGNRVDELLPGYYVHSKKLGEGGFGKVYLATHLKTNQKVAIKVMNKKKLGHDLPRVRTEIAVLKTLHHDNIAKLLQVVETSTQITLVLEYCSGGELFDYLISKRRLNENEVRVIIWDLFQVLSYIHSRGFAHRDLKPENILFDQNQKIKLIDFGLAANGQANKNNIMFLQTCCGSPAYAAPELLRGETYAGPAVDVWSSGVLLYSLLVGSLPFDDEELPNMYRKIQIGKFTMPLYLSGDVRDLITEMLRTNPRERIEVPGVLNHRWLKKFHGTSANKVDPDQIDSEAMELANRFFPNMSKVEFEKATADYGYHTATYLLLKNNEPAKKALSEKLDRSEALLARSNSPNPQIPRNNETQNLRIAAIKRKLALEGEAAQKADDVDGSKRLRDDDSKRYGVTMAYSNATPTRRVAMPLTGTPRLTNRVQPVPPPRTNIVTNRPATGTTVAPRLTKIDDRTAKKIVSPHSRLTDKRFEMSPRTPNKTPQNVASIKSPLRELKNEVNSPRTPITPKQDIIHTPVKKPALKAFSTSKKSLFKRIIESATPAKSKEPRKLTTSTHSNNITMTTFQDPQECIDRLVHKLAAKGVECKQKDFALKCHFDDKVHTPLRFELEICTFNGLCVIHRKRLRGDPWNYKKICELVLVISNEQQLAALAPDNAQSSIASLENRPPVTYLVSTNL